MVDSITVEEESSHVAKPRSSSSGRRRTLAQQLMPQESPPGLADCSRKHVVVVMDGLKEFTMEPLQWVLKNMALEASCTITLLGVMPWLNLPLFSKTWSDIWSLNLEDFSIIEEKSEWKSDVLYKKVQRLTALCQQYGVKPQVRSGMGYPLPLLAVEQIASLQATLVVFDRHHQKYREYYAEKIPCDMVMMNEEGEVDIIEGGSLTDSDLESTPGISPASSAPSPILVFAEHLRNIIFKQRS